MLEADRARLAQVVANLLNNAAKYTDDGGRHLAGGDPRRRRLGRGPSPRQRHRDRPTTFGTTSSSCSRNPTASLARTHGGLGIGLALVRALVEQHGGRVAVSSDGPGSGSEFVIRLPGARSASEQPVCRTSPVPCPARQSARRVLVVDDSLDSARSLAKLLSRWGHTVRVAHDGLEALDAAREFQPDLVFLDIGLPGMDGYEVASRLRREIDRTVLHLVGLSGYGQESDRQRAHRAGFDRYFVKPADLDQLREVLNQPLRD